MEISSKKMSFFALLILVAGIVTPSFGQVSLAQRRTVPSCAKYPGGGQCLLTSKLRAIVLGNFTYGFNHTVGYPNLDSTISRIARTETPAWTVGRMTAGAQVTTAALANYQVFFANYISGFGGGRTAGFTAASQNALQNFVEVLGNGMFLMHSSGDSPSNTAWPWYGSVVHPCHYTSEAGAGSSASTGRVGVWSQNNKAAKNHPIMEGITWGGTNPDSTTIVGMELHTFDRAISNAAITPVGWQGLLGLNAATCGTPNTCSGNSYNYTTQGGTNGWPVSWTFPATRGAIGYFMEGHDQATMNNMTRAIWDKYFKQMMYYIAGYDTTQVTTIGPKSHQEFALDQSGISFHIGEPGVLITKPGSHLVSICDIAGHEIKALRGSQSPVDYNFSEELRGSGKGLYVVRVAMAGGVKSKPFLLN